MLAESALRYFFPNLESRSRWRNRAFGNVMKAVRWRPDVRAWDLRLG